MSDELIYYVGRTNTPQIIDQDDLHHSDELTPLHHLFIDVINAGYRGVVIDEKRLNNGRYFIAMSTNTDTPEGRILSNISAEYANGMPTSPSRKVLVQIRKDYDCDRWCKGGL